MSLLIWYIIHLNFTSCLIGFLQLVIINFMSFIPDYVLEFVGDPNFGAFLDRCLGPIKISICIRDFGVPFLGFISYGAPLSLHANKTSLRVTFTLNETGSNEHCCHNSTIYPLNRIIYNYWIFIWKLWYLWINKYIKLHGSQHLLMWE